MQAAAIGMDEIDADGCLIASFSAERDPHSVGRPDRCPDLEIRADGMPSGPVDADDVDLTPAQVGVAAYDELRSVRRPRDRRRVRERSSGGDGVSPGHV